MVTTKSSLIWLCVTGFCADSLITWWGIRQGVLYEANPITARVIEAVGVAAFVLIAMFKVMILLMLVGFAFILRHEERRAVFTGSFIALVLIGWGPALWNLSLYMKGVS